MCPRFISASEQIVTGCFQAASRLQPLYYPSIPTSMDSIPWAWPSLHSVPCATTGRESHSTSLSKTWLVCRFFLFFFVSCFLSKYFVVRTCFFFFLARQLDTWMDGCKSLNGVSKASRILLTRQAITITLFRRSRAPNALAAHEPTTRTTRQLQDGSHSSVFWHVMTMQHVPPQQ